MALSGTLFETPPYKYDKEYEKYERIQNDNSEVLQTFKFTNTDTNESRLITFIHAMGQHSENRINGAIFRDGDSVISNEVCSGELEISDQPNITVLRSV